VKISIAALTLPRCIFTPKHKNKNTESEALAPLYLKPLRTLHFCERYVFLSSFKLKNEVVYV
jgi:hypothetical protein